MTCKLNYSYQNFRLADQKPKMKTSEEMLNTFMKRGGEIKKIDNHVEVNKIYERMTKTIKRAIND